MWVTVGSIQMVIDMFGGTTHSVHSSLDVTLELFSAGLANVKSTTSLFMTTIRKEVSSTMEPKDT